jgi:hypothetical protein
MTKMENVTHFVSRRAKASLVPSTVSSATGTQGTKPPLMPDQLSSYIAVNADGTAPRRR